MACHTSLLALGTERADTLGLREKENQYMKTLNRIVAVAAIALAAGAAVAGPADYTVVNEPASNNQTHDKLLAAMYGGTFATGSVINGATNMKVGALQNTTFNSYSNGAITATRIMDRGGDGLFQLITGNNNDDDQSWSDGVVNLKVTSKFASDTHTFGWVDKTNGNTKNALLDTSSGATVNVKLSSDFKWFLDTSSENNLTSVEQDNKGVGTFKNNFFDQMVSYEITGVDGQKRYVLFWEDRVNGQAYDDYDYNDAVIEIVVVPLPPAAMAGGVMLLGVAALRRRFAR